MTDSAPAAAGGTLNDPFSQLTGALAGTTRMHLEVVESRRLTPGMQRLVLTAPELASLENQPGQDVMLMVDTDASRPVRRRYTIRALDRGLRLLTLEVVRHGDGPGERWVAAAGPGARVRARSGSGCGPPGCATRTCPPATAGCPSRRRRFPGTTVAVIGCGGVGVAAIQGARISGASVIAGVDPVESKHEPACRFGATHALHPDHLGDISAELTAGEGFDYVFEVVGTPQTSRAAGPATLRVSPHSHTARTHARPYHSPTPGNASPRRNMMLRSQI